MVCSIDDIVSRRPGKHTRFPTVYTYVVICCIFLTVVRVSLSLSFFHPFPFFISSSLSTLFVYLSILSFSRKLFARAAWAFNYKSLFSVSNSVSRSRLCIFFCFIISFYAS